MGVQQAQEFGVRVHLVGIKPSRGSQSLSLLQEADTTHEWTEAEVASFLSCKPKSLFREARAPRKAVTIDELSGIGPGLSSRWATLRADRVGVV